MTFLFLLPAILGVGDPGPEMPPARKLEQIRKELVARRPVTLVAEKGLPVWYRWRIGPMAINGPGAGDRALELGIGSLVLLELLPDVPVDRFRFEAEIQIEQAGRLGRAGVYFGGQDRPTAQGVEACFASLALGPRDDAAWLLSDVCRVRERRGEIGSLHHRFQGFQQRLKAPLGKADWRKLAIEVTPADNQLLLDGAVLARIPQADQTKRLNRLLTLEPNLKTPPLEFAPRGGLGLFVQDATVRFRRVVVQPLPDPPAPR